MPTLPGAARVFCATCSRGCPDTTGAMRARGCPGNYNLYIAQPVAGAARHYSCEVGISMRARGCPGNYNLYIVQPVAGAARTLQLRGWHLFFSRPVAGAARIPQVRCRQLPSAGCDPGLPGNHRRRKSRKPHFVGSRRGGCPDGLCSTRYLRWEVAAA